VDTNLRNINQFQIRFIEFYVETLIYHFNVYISRIRNKSQISLFHLYSIHQSFVTFAILLFFYSNSKYFNTLVFCYLDQFMHAEAARSKANTKAFHFHFLFGRNKTKQKLFFARKKILWKDKTSQNFKCKNCYQRFKTPFESKLTN